MWIDVEGGRLYAEITGNGPPLLLVHGWPLDHRMFTAQTDDLAGTFQVITFDRRGFGRSDAPPDLRLELADIDTILDKLELDSTHLLGMSQGGRIALRYAVSNPHRLRSLLLQGAVIDGFDVATEEDERVPVEAFAALAQAGRLDEVRQRWLAHPMMSLGDGFDAEAELLRRILADYDGSDLLLNGLDSYRFDGDVLNGLTQLDVPTLLLTGSAETVARKRHAEEIRKRVAGADEAVFRNSGHLSNLTEAQAFNRAVRAFCTSAELRRSAQDAALLIE